MAKEYYILSYIDRYVHTYILSLLAVEDSAVSWPEGFTAKR
jgi:hypothetical protein